MEDAENRIRASAIRPRLVAGLDAWIPLRSDVSARRELADLADRLSEPDEFRRELRDALVKQDRARMRDLAKRNLSAFPPTVLSDLGLALANSEAYEEAVMLLKPAQQRYPNDFGINFELANCLMRCPGELGLGRSDEAIPFYRVAVALRSENQTAHVGLAVALQEQGRSNEAAAEWRTVIQLDPTDAFTCAWAHYYRGDALRSQGKLEEAAADYRAAMRQDPKIHAHDVCGDALRSQGKLEEAAADYRAAIQLDPKDNVARQNLCVALAENGDFAGALSEYKNWQDLLPSTHPSVTLASGVNACGVEKLMELQSKLRAVLTGEAKASDAWEGCTLAWICQMKKAYAASAQLYADSFAAVPGLAETNRYDAARAAALAGCGQGKDAGGLTECQRARWRKQALDWLRADLDALVTQDLGIGSQNRQAAARQLRIWLCHVDFAGVRDETELMKLPQDEQAAWRKFWADVAALIERAEKR